MREPRFCPVHSTTEAAFDAADHEDLKGDEYENIEVYNCPACGGRHRYHNGRPTLAPVVFECRHCGDPIDSMGGGGGMSFCDESCRAAAMREAAETLDDAVSGVFEGFLDGFEAERDLGPSPEEMQERIDDLRERASKRERER